MALTKNQKKIVNSALLVLAEQRLRIEQEMHDATIISIKKRDVCRGLEAMYIQLSSLLKPRDVKKEVQVMTAKLEETECVKTGTECVKK
jgi:hypothetical protein